MLGQVTGREHMGRGMARPSGTAPVFNIQRFCVQDGPGVRTTVFFKGCPLRCAWCSNPESQTALHEVGHNDTLCTRCGRCLEVCEVGARSLAAARTRIDRGTCISCGTCAGQCLAGALRVYGADLSLEKVYAEVVRDKPFYGSSGGGVTASGGEPLLYADFVASLFARCGVEGIHTCLETCGDAPESAWDTVLPYTDLVLFDLKVMDPRDHERLTGRSNARILARLAHVDDAAASLIIRVPLIPGITDTVGNLTAIASLAGSLKKRPEVHLLPYHLMGESKYGMLDRCYSLSDLKRQTERELAAMKATFESFELECAVIE
jgi:pyruvate formate lyase activating enzyme